MHGGGCDYIVPKCAGSVLSVLMVGRGNASTCRTSVVVGLFSVFFTCRGCVFCYKYCLVLLKNRRRLKRKNKEGGETNIICTLLIGYWERLVHFRKVVMILYLR